MEAVQEEIEHLKREIIEANEDRAKAAEYGLVLLEEKQALAGQIEELNNLYDTARRELETAVEVGQLQSYRERDSIGHSGIPPETVWYKHQL